MILADTSVLLAGFATWHERHTDALATLDHMPSVMAHAALELYSVLTRLPGDARVPPATVREWLDERFPGTWTALAPAAVRRLPERLSSTGVSGGATYDGLIALTAVAVDATLVSLDRRALPTYRRCGATVQWL